jgi:hypothetical protein
VKHGARAIKRLAFLIVVATVAGCGSEPRYVDLPSNHGHVLDNAVERLHAAGLRVSFDAAETPCGDGLPWVNVQAPRAPVRVRTNSVVRLRFGFSPIPSPAVPTRHERWTVAPTLVGLEFERALKRVHAAWLCVHVRPTRASSASRVIVISQNPNAGTRLPAYGVMVGRGFRPTTIDVTVAAV